MDTILSCRVLKFLVIYSLIAISPLRAADSVPSPVGPTGLVVIFTGADGCNENQKQAINDSFLEMNRMIGRDDGLPNGVDRYPEIDWNSTAAVEFWGSAKTSIFRDNIKDNLDYMAGLRLQAWPNPFAPRFHVRCDDPLNICNACPANQGTTTAYTWGGEPYISFCPSFFKLGKLDDIVNSMANSTSAFERNNINSYINRAYVWAHEIMHIPAIGHSVAYFPDPGVVDVVTIGYNAKRGDGRAYGGARAKWLAASINHPPADPVNNAENYALFTLANYVIKTKGFYPRFPTIDIRSLENGTDPGPDPFVNCYASSDSLHLCQSSQARWF